MFANPDPRVTENYKAIAMTDAPTKVNLMFVKGANGVLVIGQINQVSPAKYFTYLMKDVKEIPSALVTYLVENAAGRSADVCLVFGFANGKEQRVLLNVAFDATVNGATQRMGGSVDHQVRQGGCGSFGGDEPIRISRDQG